MARSLGRPPLVPLRYHGRMALSPELLKILVCPVDHGELDLRPDQSGLKCRTCHRVYRIEDDIPIMLADEARIEP